MTEISEIGKCRLYKVLLIVSAALLTLCSCGSETKLETGTESPRFSQTESIPTESEESKISESETSALVPVPDTTEQESKGEEKAPWIEIFDLDSADIRRGSESSWLFWTDSCLMRYSNGVYFTEPDHDLFYARLDAIRHPEGDVPENDFPAPMQIFVGDEFDGLKVTAAQFVVLDTKNFNFASISFSGCAVLKGVLYIRNEDDPYIGIGKQGDVWFFPYPESIEQYPLCFAPQDYLSACIDECSFHIYADTPPLYLGNIEDGKLHTRINEIQWSDWSVDDVDWTLNDELRETLRSDDYQFICYEAELEISEIKLLYYEDCMTGSPHSSANVSGIVSLSPL